MAAIDVSSSPGSLLNRSQATISPSNVNVPINPFSRTLASLEPKERVSGEDRTSAEGTIPGNSKASLDVESFKNLLLTGKPTPGPSAQPTQIIGLSNSHSGPQFESSSSTDTSSISRQSLFELPHEGITESERTSYGPAESEEDENMGLVSEVHKGKKKPPPAPKHRHGKLMTTRQPQTVSFDSFAATNPKSPPTIRSRGNSETNKPLPPVPLVSSHPPHISTQDTTHYQSQPVQPNSTGRSEPSDVPTPQKRTPPPVPLARRQSQLRTSTGGNRSRSNSSLTISSQHTIDTLASPVSSNNDPMSVAKSPPPPPRSRHGARLANISTSSANSSSTELPQRSGSLQAGSSASGHRSSLGGIETSEPSSPVLGVNRTSSISSTRNAQRTVSGESTASANMPPPPPPPPRRRQSNRSSMDQQRPNIPTSSPTESRRTSTEYRRTSLDSKRRTSVASESSLRREYAPADEKRLNENALYSPKEENANMLDSSASLVETRSDSNTILDDMEKFQREIDELRNRYKQAG